VDLTGFLKKVKISENKYCYSNNPVAFLSQDKQGERQ
jgi:hypothetical protein